MFRCQVCDFIPCACGNQHYNLTHNYIALKKDELEDIILALRLTPPANVVLLPWLEKCLKRWKELSTANKVTKAP